MNLRCARLTQTMLADGMHGNNSHCARLKGVVIERHMGRQAKHGHGGGRIILSMSSRLI